MRAVLSPSRGRNDLVGARGRHSSLVAPDAVEPFGAGGFLLAFGDHAQRFDDAGDDVGVAAGVAAHGPDPVLHRAEIGARLREHAAEGAQADRKSTRLNSSHSQISYAVFCLK